MKRSNRLLILIGVFLAVFAFIGVVLISNTGGTATATSGPTATPETTVDVVIAAVDIHLGDKITADMVTTKKVTLTEQTRLGDDTYSSPLEVIGKIAGGTIGKDEVLHSSTDFLASGTMAKGQSIAGGIAPDMVAVSLEVDQVNGVGNLLVPGDHVDLILSMWVGDLKLAGKTVNGNPVTAGSNPVTAKLIIQNRKVLATLLPPPPEEQSTTTAAPKAAKSSDTVTNNGQHMYVILEVKPQEAEVIRYAQREEKIEPQNYITLGFALRSDKDNDKPDTTTTGINFSRLVQMYNVLPPDPRGILPPDINKGIQW